MWLYFVVGPIRATQAPQVHASHSDTGSQPKSSASWTESTVQEWLKKEKLDDLCDKLEGLDGSHLEELYNQYCRDPQQFGNDMRSDYQMSGKMCLKFTVALKKLHKK